MTLKNLKVGLIKCHICERQVPTIRCRKCWYPTCGMDSDITNKRSLCKAEEMVK